ncbi:MAG: stilbene synthase [Candidatus Kapabacteria bacterium]|nr:stilbene synthase [Candidatus Kapabacteria bacterium]
MIDVRIVGVGTAVPKNIVDQASIRKIIHDLFHSSVADLPRLLTVYDHEHIQTRRFVRPPEWYAEPRGFAESNAVYSESAIDLATEAARIALSSRESEVAAIVVASTTGIMTPSLDAALIQTLGLSQHVARIPIFGLGCAAGVAGLARAADLSRALGGRLVLFVAVEICSVTFQHSDASRSNIIGSSIFGDGAAAVCVGASATGPIIMGGYSTLFPDTEDIMGWDVTDTGLRVRFSRDIPSFIQSHLPHVISDACALWGISVEDIGSYIAHPGGAKVLEAYADATGKPLDSFRHSFDVLREHGNMSSASVLFVLERWLNDSATRSRYTVMSALGPGFSAEQILLKNEINA